MPAVMGRIIHDEMAGSDMPQEAAECINEGIAAMLPTNPILHGQNQSEVTETIRTSKQNNGG